MSHLTGKKVAILATDGFEQSELEQPRDALKAAGATVEVVSPKSGEIRGWQMKDWGTAVKVDRALDKAKAADYDALVVPGGVINPDKLRVEPKAVQFVKDFYAAKKPIASICHGPWLLVEADVLEGVQVTSYGSIRTDVENAGALWVDRPVVVDQGIVTSRNPDDLPAFCRKMIEEIAEGRHTRRDAAE